MDFLNLPFFFLSKANPLMLEAVLSMMKHVHDAAQTLHNDDGQIEQAQELLTRTEALPAEFHRCLTQLQRVQTLLDQVATQTCSFYFHAKPQVVTTILRRPDAERRQG